MPACVCNKVFIGVRVCVLCGISMVVYHTYSTPPCGEMLVCMLYLVRSRDWQWASWWMGGHLHHNSYLPTANEQYSVPGGASGRRVLCMQGSEQEELQGLHIMETHALLLPRVPKG